MEKIQNKSRANYLRLVILIAIVAAIAALFRFTSLQISDFKPEKIRQFILSFGVWAPVIFIVIYALRGAILVIPVGVMSLAGGLTFGKGLGTLYILVGATLGASFSFFIARYFGRKFIENFEWLHKGKIKKFDDNIEKNGFRMMMFMRLIPLFQYDAVNFGGGLSKMRFRDFALASFIGMAPGGFINAMLGSSLDNVVSVQFFVAIGLFILMMFVPAIYKKIKNKKIENVAEIEAA